VPQKTKASYTAKIKMKVKLHMKFEIN